VIKLYRKLGVQFAQRGFTYSFTQLSPLSKQTSPNFLYNGKNGLRGISLPSSFRASVSTPVEFIRVYVSFFAFTFIILCAYMRLLYLCMPKNRPMGVEQMTLKEWTAHTLPGGLFRLVGADAAWTAFVSDVLVPLFSAVCTAPTEDVWQHPVEEILGELSIMHLHSGLFDL
jgi:hypothetical protein